MCFGAFGPDFQDPWASKEVSYGGNREVLPRPVRCQASRGANPPGGEGAKGEGERQVRQVACRDSRLLRIRLELY